MRIQEDLRKKEISDHVSQSWHDRNQDSTSTCTVFFGVVFFSQFSKDYVRYLIVSDQVDTPYPRCILFQRSKWISQLFTVSISILLFRDVTISVSRVRLQPHGIGTVDPRVHHVKGFVTYDRFEFSIQHVNIVWCCMWYEWVCWTLELSYLRTVSTGRHNLAWKGRKIHEQDKHWHCKKKSLYTSDKC